MAFIRNNIFICLIIFLPSYGYSGNSENIINKAEQCLQSCCFDSSICYYQGASEVFQTKKNWKEYSYCQNKLGEIYGLLGNTDKAIFFLEKNEKEIQKNLGVNNELLANCYDLLGDVYYSISDIEEAGMYFKKALIIKQKLFGEKDARTAFSYRNMGRYYNDLIVKDSAFYYTKKAITICEKYPAKVHLIKLEMVYNDYAYAYKILKRDIPSNYSMAYDSTRILLNKAIHIADNNCKKESPEKAIILHNIGNTYTDCLLHDIGAVSLSKNSIVRNANYYYDESLRINKNIYGSINPRISTTYFVKGIMYEYAYGKDSLFTALKYYNEGIRALVKDYKSNDIFALPDIENCHNKYLLMTLLSWKTFGFETLYKTTKDQKYLYALYEYNDLRVRLWDKIIGSYKTREVNQILNIYSNVPFHSAINAAIFMYEATKDETYKRKAFEYAEKSKYSILFKSIAEAKAQNGNKAFPNTISIEKLQKNLLDSNTAFIEYIETASMDGRKALYLLLITQNLYDVIKIQNIDSLKSQVLSMNSAIRMNDPQKYSTNAISIYNSILKPALSLLPKNIDELIIAGDEMTSLIPFSALLTEKPISNDYRHFPYLVNKYKTSFALSASILNTLVHEDGKSSSKITGFAPSFDNKSQLPFSEKSLHNISGILSGDYYFDKKATKSVFKEKAKNYTLIHLATHAEYNSIIPLESKIYFSAQGNLKDDYLTVKEIYDIRIAANLLILAACETGIGKFENGEGLNGFTRAFTFSGCKSLINTLWEVDDQATSNVIERFYKNIYLGMSKNDALHKAQLEYIKESKNSESANPFYWSGIQLTGDRGTINIDKKFDYGFLGCTLMGGVIIIGGMTYFNRKRKSKFL